MEQAQTHEMPISQLGAETEEQMINRQLEAHGTVLHDVLKEITRGQIKHGVQDRPAHEWLLILNEEHGEYGREVCIAYFEGREFAPEIRKELVETAAVALRALRNYDERLAQHKPAKKELPRIAAGPGTPYPGPTELAAQLRTGSLSPNGGAIIQPAACQVPPKGWVCSRPAGHSGPCAASPVAERPAPTPCHLCAATDWNARGLGGCNKCVDKDPTHGPNNPHSAQPE